MAETSAASKKLHISPVGGFLVGLFLGAGVLFVYHAKVVKGLGEELDKEKKDAARLEKVQRELRNLLAGVEARIEKLESRGAAK
jgi:hypothetical protein